MRIAYLARRPIPSRYANSVQIMKMCEAFAGAGHDVTLYGQPGDAPVGSAFQRYDVAPIFEIETLPSRSRTLRKIRFLAGIVRRVRALAPDLIYGRDILSLYRVGRLGIPIVYEAHGIPARNSLEGRALRQLLGMRNFSHLVCVTSTLSDWHREAFPDLDPARIMVAPMAASAHRIAAAGPLTDWPGRPDALQVGFIGRPFPGKGIEAMAAAARQLGQVDFHIVGADRSDLGWLDGDLPHNLHLHGYQPHGSLPSYLARFDVAAAPYGAKVMNASGAESASTTSPLKLPEYMAAGLPIIVSALPGVRDMLADSDCALLIAPGDDLQFTKAVARLAEDPELRLRLGNAARRCYLDRHTVERRAEAVLQGPPGALTRGLLSFA